MNPPRISLDQLHIPEPCPVAWSTMQGDDRTRFCSHCQKHVHNLSAMSRADAERVLARETSPCVQVTHDSAGRIVHQPAPSGWRRFRPVAMASMFFCAVLTLIGCRQSTGGAPLPATRPADCPPDAVRSLGKPVAGMAVLRGEAVAGPSTSPAPVDPAR